MPLGKTEARDTEDQAKGSDYFISVVINSRYTSKSSGKVEHTHTHVRTIPRNSGLIAL